MPAIIASNQAPLPQANKVFYFAMLYALLLCIDITAAFIILNNSDTEVAVYESETRADSNSTYSPDLLSSSYRTSQAAQFTHPLLTKKTYTAVNFPFNFRDSSHFERHEDTSLPQTPWFLTNRHCRKAKVSGWKDSNVLYKSLALIRTNSLA